MFIFNKPVVLPVQLKWKYADEPELLGWTIRARNYNTFVADLMFWFCFISTVIVAVVMYQTTGDDPVFDGALSLLFFIVVTIALTSITHQKMKFVFRFTTSGMEYCEWKDFPKWMLTFLKWLAGVTAVVFISLASIDPSFLFGALVGPSGIGLTYLMMANSEGYQKMHTIYHHLSYEWKEFNQLTIATNRELVELKYSLFDEDSNRLGTWSENIFCKDKQKEILADFIKPYLSPGVPFIRAKVDVFS